MSCTPTSSLDKPTTSATLSFRPFAKSRGADRRGSPRCEALSVRCWSDIVRYPLISVAAVLHPDLSSGDRAMLPASYHPGPERRTTSALNKQPAWRATAILELLS